MEAVTISYLLKVTSAMTLLDRVLGSLPYRDMSRWHPVYGKRLPWHGPNSFIPHFCCCNAFTYRNFPVRLFLSSAHFSPHYSQE